MSGLPNCPLLTGLVTATCLFSGLPPFLLLLGHSMPLLSRFFCSVHRMFVAGSHLAPPGAASSPGRDSSSVARDWIKSPNSELWAYMYFKYEGGRVFKCLRRRSVGIKRYMWL